MVRMKGHLTLIGYDFDTDYITDSLNVQPTYIRKKDEKLGNGRLFGKTEWGIETEETIHYTETQWVFDELFSPVRKKLKQMADLAARFNAEWHILFSIAIEGKETPVLFFTQDAIQTIAAINGQLGLDCFIT